MKGQGRCNTTSTSSDSNVIGKSLSFLPVLALHFTFIPQKVGKAN